jgi:hypothetical protein
MRRYCGVVRIFPQRFYGKATHKHKHSIRHHFRSYFYELNITSYSRWLWHDPYSAVCPVNSKATCKFPPPPQKKKIVLFFNVFQLISKPHNVQVPLTTLPAAHIHTTLYRSRQQTSTTQHIQLSKCTVFICIKHLIQFLKSICVTMPYQIMTDLYRWNM